MDHPLAGIIETKTYPYSRILRTSFAQKIWDTFSTMVVGYSHKGIFDYITLFIPLGLIFLLQWSYDNRKENFFAAALLIPIILINIPFATARVVFGAAATIIFSPIVAIVHGISRLMAGQSHAEALDLVGQISSGEEQPLGVYLANAHMDIEDLTITIEKDIQEPKEIESLGEKKVGFSNYQLLFRRKVAGPSSSLSFVEDSKEDCKDNHAPFSIKMRLGEKNSPIKQANNIHALFKLNGGNVVKNIEDANDTIISPTDKLKILAI